MPFTAVTALSGRSVIRKQPLNACLRNALRQLCARGPLSADNVQSDVQSVCLVYTGSLLLLQRFKVRCQFIDCLAGFKEMYCDVNPDGVLAKPTEGEARLGPPRQQVFEALAQLLKENVEVCFVLTGIRPSVAVRPK